MDAEELDVQLMELKRQREEKMETVTNQLSQLGDIQEEIHHPMRDQDWNSTVQTTSQFLELRNKLMELNLEKAKLEQQAEESPAEVVKDLKESYAELQQAIAEIDGELKHWTEVEAQYNALGQPFKDLLRQWTELENKISVKEWSLKELENMQECSSFSESSLFGESFSR